MTRDSQRSRVYAAEEAADIRGRRSALGKRLLRDTEVNASQECVIDDRVHLLPYPSIRSTQAYVDAVRTSAKFRRRWGHVSLTVVTNHGYTSRGGMGVLHMSAAHRRDEEVILHEIAHNLVGTHHQHGPPFAATLLSLVGLFLGTDEAAALRAAYAAHGVKYRTGTKYVPKPDEDRLARARRVRVKAMTPDPRPILSPAPRRGRDGR